MDIFTYNQEAWNRQSIDGSEWCAPVDDAQIKRARAGDWQVILTPNKPVPREWFDGVDGKHVLCLASGGGQQAPIIAAAGAEVVSFDASSEQLKKDEKVASRHHLNLKTIKGDMAKLDAFENETFDLIFHPVSNVFVPDVKPVWKACYRVLRKQGRLLAGFMNPQFYLFDHGEVEKTGDLKAVYRLPFAEMDHLTPKEKERRLKMGEPLEFSHTLDDQLGGQTAAGFVIAGFYEDWWNDEVTPLNHLAPTSMATLALKLS